MQLVTQIHITEIKMELSVLEGSSWKEGEVTKPFCNNIVIGGKFHGEHPIQGFCVYER